MESELTVSEGMVLSGKYRIERLIGSGGMGSVYLATHTELCRPVAIKLMHPQGHEQEEAARRFLVEAKAMSRLHSVHTAQILDLARLPSGTPYLVMEYLVGRTLQDLVQGEGPLPVAKAVEYVLHACDSIAEAHRAKIIHRDLKTGNLFLTTDTYGRQTIKVLDFGISKSLDGSLGGELGLTQSRSMMGSPYFMSPEQMRSARDVDHRTDIWSMGVVLFELLTARAVWQADTLSELCAQVGRDPCPMITQLRPGLSDVLAKVVSRCLEKDPIGRYQSIADLAQALGPFAGPSGPVLVANVFAAAGRSDGSIGETTIPPESRAEVPPSCKSLSESNAVVARSLVWSRHRLGPLAVALMVVSGIAFTFLMGRSILRNGVHVAGDGTVENELPGKFETQATQPSALLSVSSAVAPAPATSAMLPSSQRPMDVEPKNSAARTIPANRSAKSAFRVSTPLAKPALSASHSETQNDPMNIRE